MKYSVIAEEKLGYEIAEKSCTGEEFAVITAEEFAKKYADANVYIRFYHKSKGQVGYLNQDGNHDITGKPWVFE
ncbi:hypothetical protein [Paenibacillus sp. JCM 10914]|uniref:hypothetical protein n=1 Tax=Paenibacillus sp. JCM 10914 TaxID=1236974 RepID=UPI0003CC4B44|nr:hypothetical protein [Paenibacillus sp. JCM 10914]GAE10035.1 hypothetical protein JCM10914_6435 [Paenibacillus sp. JCM 10914]